MIPNLHQRGELIAPLPRHQRGMCMPMTLPAMETTISVKLTIWIVILWTSKPMCKSSIPRILHLIGIEHVKNHILLHAIGMETFLKPCLISQQWHSLQPDVQAIGDLLSDEAKPIILGLCKDPEKHIVNLQASLPSISSKPTCIISN